MVVCVWQHSEPPGGQYSIIHPPHYYNGAASTLSIALQLGPETKYCALALYEKETKYGALFLHTGNRSAFEFGKIQYTIQAGSFTALGIRNEACFCLLFSLSHPAFNGNTHDVMSVYLFLDPVDLLTRDIETICSGRSPECPKSHYPVLVRAS